MYNENDEMYDVDDFDADIQTKQALIEEAKMIDMEAEPFEVSRKINDLKRKWKRISSWESDFEEQLSNEFENILDIFYKKRKEGFTSNEAMKLDVIEQAKKIVLSSNFNEATKELNNLMAQWKSIGSSGKEKDDVLWESFNEIRQSFYDRKQKYWDELKVKFEHARVVKQELIEEVELLVSSEDWQGTSKKLQELMTKWKSIGSAGKEFEDELWNAFNEKRQIFYDRRDQYYALMKDEQLQNLEQKQTLLQKAMEILNKKEYTKELTAQMKELSVEWKKIGSSGKENENQIWQDFRIAMDAYFLNLRQYNDQKHAAWRQKMQDARKTKQEMIAKQKQQIKYMQNEIVGLLGQRAIDEMNEDIKDKEEFILELEQQIADIDQSLNK